MFKILKSCSRHNRFRQQFLREGNAEPAKLAAKAAKAAIATLIFLPILHVDRRETSTQKLSKV
jgi:hypothetical protein